ncbi:Hypothetical predicted protein [Prunus dulcis]|uniref:Uncharacterized protein n=1 Tax=Prunus dulcis TaxID=3755 RepID=A0A5E4E2L6_PRUDU|nr:Hypothetical predicted protein [Prunus dulcis]
MAPKPSKLAGVDSSSAHSVKTSRAHHLPKLGLANPQNQNRSNSTSFHPLPKPPRSNPGPAPLPNGKGHAQVQSHAKILTKLKQKGTYKNSKGSLPKQPQLQGPHSLPKDQSQKCSFFKNSQLQEALCHKKFSLAERQGPCRDYGGYLSEITKTERPLWLLAERDEGSEYLSWTQHIRPQRNLLTTPLPNSKG